MANKEVKFQEGYSGFGSRKQELEYDGSILSVCELMANKVMELLKVLDQAGIDPDKSSVKTQKHLEWAVQFFESFRTIFKLERQKSSNNTKKKMLANAIKPLATYIHERQK